MSNPRPSKSSLPRMLLVPTALAVAVAAAAKPSLFTRWFDGDDGRDAPRVTQVSGMASNAAVRGAQGPAMAGASRPAQVGAYDIGGLQGQPSREPKGLSPGERGTWIVTFRELPLASYAGGVPGLPAAKRSRASSGRMKLDVKSLEAVAYVDHLRNKQAGYERAMASAIGEPLAVRIRMQHALNAVVADMTEAQARRIARLPGVLRVEPERMLEQSTDVGPTLIGAPQLWNGSATGSTLAGEGMVIGIIDSGINFGSPSFAAVDPIDGYTHVNPLGGTVLGTCAPGGVDQGRCNTKLIGGYDFVCNAPANQCGVTDVREEPGFGDTNGHGTHVASTAAGNRRDVVFSGAPLRISGVAPRANIIAYDVCFTNTATGRGLCPSSSSTAAVNQAIADGVVDAINFSISGGTSPWTDSVSLAFLNATNAGIFVAAAAGNSGPGASTTSHIEPWVTTVAAAQHGRSAFGILISATGPTPVPGNLIGLVGNQSTGGAQLGATIPASTPLRISAGIDTADDGCNAFAANAFSGAIAVIRRGTCNFTVKIGNAANAGAVAVIIANNQAGAVIPSTPGTTIPAFAISQTEGNALRDFGQANPATATAQITFPSVGVPNTADALADFSSRGPALNPVDPTNPLNLSKPDITAPGVQVLAAYAGTALTGSEALISTLNGTSMASPHVAGAALLVRQARPTWTAAEVQSALMMTTKRPVFLEDQVTAANPFAAGAGRVQVERAANAGLVLHETRANFLAADPSGGNPDTIASLNIASYARNGCYGNCTFTRTFRNTRTYGALWRVQVEGVPSGVTVSAPNLIWVPYGATASVTATANGAGTGSFNFDWRHFRITLTEYYSAGVPRPETTLSVPVAIASIFIPPIAPPPTSRPEVSTAGPSARATRVGACAWRSTMLRWGEMVRVPGCG